METHRKYEKGHEFNLIYLFTKLSATIIFYNQVLKARNNHILLRKMYNSKLNHALCVQPNVHEQYMNMYSRIISIIIKSIVQVPI